MKKNNIKKLQFNYLSITELNAIQLNKIVGGGEDTGSNTDTCKTQTGPPDKFSTKCEK